MAIGALRLSACAFTFLRTSLTWSRLPDLEQLGTCRHMANARSEAHLSSMTAPSLSVFSTLTIDNSLQPLPINQHRQHSMAQPTPAAIQAGNAAQHSTNTTDTSLIVEDVQKQLVQAQFTRLQMALGLKGIEANRMSIKQTCITPWTNLPMNAGNYSLGDDIKELVADKPTGLKRKGDVVLIGLDIKIERTGTRISRVSWSASKLDTAILEKASPKNVNDSVSKSACYRNTISLDGTHMTSAEVLSSFRYALTNALEPSCHGNQNHVVSRHDPRYHDHEQHLFCHARKSIILILPKKVLGIRDLKALGYDPKNQYVLINQERHR